MDTKNLPLTVLIMAFTLNSAFGRIGETEKEIEARYGKPAGLLTKENDRDEMGNPFRSYLFHGFQILVIFVNGKSALEHFGKPYVGGEVTYADSLAILNAYGDIWQLDRKDDPPHWHWHSSDHNLQAYLDGSGLGIIDTVYEATRILKMRDLESKKLEGF